MKDKPTEGPWEITGQLHIWSPTTGNILAITCGEMENCSEDESDSQRTANAYMMAASLDLYEVLKEVVEIADRKTDEFDNAKAAIAKAEGRAA